jgi:hypothetical protein
VLSPHGTHLFIRCKLAARGGALRDIERGAFLGSELDHRLILTGKLQEYAGKGVLHFRRQTARGLDGMFKELSHIKIIASFPNGWKALRVSPMHIIFALLNQQVGF